MCNFDVSRVSKSVKTKLGSFKGLFSPSMLTDLRDLWFERMAIALPRMLVSAILRSMQKVPRLSLSQNSNWITSCVDVSVLLLPSSVTDSSRHFICRAYLSSCALVINDFGSKKRGSSTGSCSSSAGYSRPSSTIEQALDGSSLDSWTPSIVLLTSKTLTEPTDGSMPTKFWSFKSMTLQAIDVGFSLSVSEEIKSLGK